MSATNNAAAMDRDMGRADSTISQDKPAIKLFNYFLTHILGLPTLNEMDVSDLSDDLENIITGYSIYLCDKNIPRNHTKYLTDPNAIPTSYLAYSSLNKYLGKAILLTKIMSFGKTKKHSLTYLG